MGVNLEPDFSYIYIGIGLGTCDIFPKRFKTAKLNCIQPSYLMISVDKNKYICKETTINFSESSACPCKLDLQLKQNFCQYERFLFTLNAFSFKTQDVQGTLGQVDIA